MEWIPRAGDYLKNCYGEEALTSMAYETLRDLWTIDGKKIPFKKHQHRYKFVRVISGLRKYKHCKCGNVQRLNKKRCVQ